MTRLTKRTRTTIKKRQGSKVSKRRQGDKRVNVLRDLFRDMNKQMERRKNYRRQIGGVDDTYGFLDDLYKEFDVTRVVEKPETIYDILKRRGKKIAITAAFVSIAYYSYKFYLTNEGVYKELLYRFFVTTIRLLQSLTRVEFKNVYDVIYKFAVWAIKIGKIFGIHSFLYIFGTSILFSLYYGLYGIINIVNIITNIGLMM
jgi:hypothetical protein